MMTKEEAFVKYKEIFDYAEIEKPIEEIIDVDELLITPAAPSADSGLAYEGSLLFHTLMIWHFANKLLPVYNSISQVSLKSLAKVIVLHQLGKIGMFTPNEDDWQVKKLGKVYSFVEQGACLKTGDYSKRICGNAGVKFSLEEYEAMSILDKTPEEYEAMSKYRTHLSTLFKMSCDLAYTVARERYIKEQHNKK